MEKTNLHSSCPSLQGWTHSNHCLGHGAGLQSHSCVSSLRAGQKVDFSLGVTLLEVGSLCKVLAHGSWLSTNGPFNVTMTLQLPHVISWWKGEHLISGFPAGGCGSSWRSAEIRKPWGGAGDPHPTWVPTDIGCL